MLQDRILQPAFTLALILGATLLFLGVDLALNDSVASVFDEGHAVELMSPVLLFAGIVLWCGCGCGESDRRQWHIPLVLALLALREFDLDKRLTSEGVLQLRLYSDTAPAWEKAVGLAVVALILLCAWRLATVTAPCWWRGLRQGRPACWLAGGSVALIALAKTLDGLGRKLAALGIAADPRLVTVAGRVEELLELAAYVMLVQALVYAARRGRGGRPVSVPPPAGPVPFGSPRPHRR